MKKLVLFLSLVLCFVCLQGCSKSDRVRKLKIENNDVAILSIYSDNGNSETSVFYKSYGHAFLTLGTIPNAYSTTYSDVRDQVREDGKHWLHDDLRSFFNGIPPVHKGQSA
jgi:hypothetical protein